jgi:hypothetical protein
MIESSESKTDTRRGGASDRDGAATTNGAVYLAGLRPSNSPDAMAHPMMRRLIWVLFAILFYQSGMVFTTWLLEPEHLTDGLDWLWLVAFPILLPGFFMVNGQLGCVSGECPTRPSSTEPEGNADSIPYSDRMPGL